MSFVPEPAWTDLTGSMVLGVVEQPVKKHKNNRINIFMGWKINHATEENQESPLRARLLLFFQLPGKIMMNAAITAAASASTF
jgi:hypothetical protein